MRLHKAEFGEKVFVFFLKTTGEISDRKTNCPLQATIVGTNDCDVLLGFDKDDIALLSSNYRNILLYAVDLIPIHHFRLINDPHRFAKYYINSRNGYCTKNIIPPTKVQNVSGQYKYLLASDILPGDTVVFNQAYAIILDVNECEDGVELLANVFDVSGMLDCTTRGYLIKREQLVLLINRPASAD